MFAFTVRQLEILFAVCEAGSFRRAADQLGITQTGVSNHIHGLEGQLGYAFFERQRGKSARLTPAGQAFLQAAKEFVNLGRKLSTSEVHDRVDVRIFVGDHLLDDYIRPLLPEFTFRHPEITLRFLPQEAREGMLERIASGNVDCVLLSGSLDLPGTKVLGTIPSGIYATERLVDLAQTVGIESLPFIVRIPNDARSTISPELETNGISPKEIVAQVQHLDVAFKLACGGAGAIWAMESMVRKYDTKHVLRMLSPTCEVQQKLFVHPRVPANVATKLEKFLTKVARAMLR